MTRLVIAISALCLSLYSQVEPLPQVGETILITSPVLSRTLHPDDLLKGVQEETSMISADTKAEIVFARISSQKLKWYKLQYNGKFGWILEDGLKGGYKIIVSLYSVKIQEETRKQEAQKALETFQKDLQERQKAQELALAEKQKEKDAVISLYCSINEITESKSREKFSAQGKVLQVVGKDVIRFMVIESRYLERRRISNGPSRIPAYKSEVVEEYGDTILVAGIAIDELYDGKKISISGTFIGTKQCETVLGELELSSF